MDNKIGAFPYKPFDQWITKVMGEKLAKYAPEIFDQEDLVNAKGVILGQALIPGITPERRWEVETPWLAERIKFENAGLVVDYGCGIGRMSKVVKNPVLGVDISPVMRRHSIDYVGRPQDFSSVSPDIFHIMVQSGLQVDGLMTLWVLQHVFAVEFAVLTLMRALRAGGVLWHIDLEERCVPFRAEGSNLCHALREGPDPLKLLQQHCNIEEEIPVDVWPQYPEHDAGILRKLRRK